MESYNYILKGKVKPTLPNIDKYIVSPMFGYKEVSEYYKACTLKGNLKQIRVPTFYLHAMDDIVIDPNYLPVEEI